MARPAIAQETATSDVAPGPPDLSRFLPKEDLERDGRRTLGAFPKNLGRSFVGVFSRDNLGPLLIGAWWLWLGRHGISASNSADYHLSDVFDVHYLGDHTSRLT
jgi:hypothetical protein